MTILAATPPVWRGEAWRRARGYAVPAAAYGVIYIALNFVTDHRAVNGSSITLWSPDDALSLVLVMESWTFAPVVWIAQIVTDLWFGHARVSLITDAAVAAALAAGYAGMAWTLRRRFGLSVRAMRPRDLVAFMAVVPLGVAIVGLIYCVALVVVGGLAPRDFLSAFTGFWIGDATAMCVILPATGALFRIATGKPWRRAWDGYSLFLLVATFVFVVFVVFFSVSHVQNRYLFNLLFLPILLVGLKFGYDAGALALLVVQLMLLAALDYFDVSDRIFGGYEVLMFVLAISGQALAATFTEWEAATAELRRQQAELATISERATNGAIAAAMSHEISQPLASIAAYVFGARRLLETGQGAEKALAALRKAEGEAARARGIVERLRDFVAKGEPLRELVDLDELVAGIVRLHGDAARERGVALSRLSGPEAPMDARLDRIGVEQALANLVRNAIEAAPARGGEVVISLTRDEARAVIGVADNGAGVAPEIADRLFEPFETTKPRGMGLGLPLAKEVAARQGGALRWTPLSPRGVRFELELPLA